MAPLPWLYSLKLNFPNLEVWEMAETCSLDVADNGGATLDELFRRAGVQSADKIALIDPPNRSSFTDGPPRRLRRCRTADLRGHRAVCARGG